MVTKFTFRTVTNKTFELELEPDAKVKDVKARIQADQGDAFPAERTMLIHQGKILKDEEGLAEAQVTSNGFLVVMVQKAAATPAPAAAATPPQPAQTAVPTPAAPAP